MSQRDSFVPGVALNTNLCRQREREKRKKIQERPKYSGAENKFSAESDYSVNRALEMFPASVDGDLVPLSKMVIIRKHTPSSPDSL